MIASGSLGGVACRSVARASTTSSPAWRCPAAASAHPLHLGTLWRLNELAYLPKIDRISSVSGGSITCGVLAVHWPRLQWANGLATNFQDEIVKPLREFCGASSTDRRSRKERSCRGRTSATSSKRSTGSIWSRRHPAAASGSAALHLELTNFMTGVDFRFSKPYAGDYRIGQIPGPTLSVALAVTASNAFPPFLSPSFGHRSEPVQTGPRRRSLRQRRVPHAAVSHRRRSLRRSGTRDARQALQDAPRERRGRALRHRPRPEQDVVKQALRAFDIATNQARRCASGR